MDNSTLFFCFLLNIFLCFFELQNNQFLKLMNYDLLSSLCSQNFLLMRESPQTPLVGKKKKFSLFLGFDFEAGELAFFEKVIFDFLIRLIIF